jgi:hypothetical protein
MAIIKRNDVHSSLPRKGFDMRDDRDHTWFTYRTTQGKKTNVSTKTSKGTSHKDIGDVLIAKMSTQCKLTNKQFKELVDCTMDQRAYEAVLIAANSIPLD